MSALHLRPWREEDLPFLQRLRNDAALQAQLMALARGSSLEQVRAWARGRSEDPQAIFALVADAEDRPQGFIQVLRIHPDQRHGWLGLALAPEAQGQGRGAEVMALLEAAARARGLRKLMLEVLASNARARALYARCGYREVGVLAQHFLHPGGVDDAVVMEKLL